jgi:hypothetical protein
VQLADPHVRDALLRQAEDPPRRLVANHEATLGVGHAGAHRKVQQVDVPRVFGQEAPKPFCAHGGSAGASVADAPLGAGGAHGRGEARREALAARATLLP